MLRQINSALGKDMNRLQRILIHDQNIKHPINLKKLYPSMIYIYNKPNNLHAALKVFLLLASPLIVLLYSSCILAINPGVFKSSNKLSEISKILDLLESYDFVIGSRYMKGGKSEMPPFRLFLSIVGNRFIKFLLKRNLFILIWLGH